jgi:hypothetical protein
VDDFVTIGEAVNAVVDTLAAAFDDTPSDSGFTGGGGDSGSW